MEGTIMDCRCLLKSLLSLMLFVLTAPLALALQSGTASDEINAAPDVRLGPLYAAVQSAGIFPDQKTFADAIPKREPSAIVANWQRQKSLHSFDLALFVQRNFILPGAPSEYLTPTGQSLREHINSLWPILTRHTKTVARWDSLIPLPNPYVVPGGRFREVYYWDSYFTMLGLAESGCWTMVSDMVDNFASLIDRYGFIPNGNRDYYLSRSQPPFFSMMVDLLAMYQGETVYRHYLPQLEKEYRYWMAGADYLKPGSADQRVVRLLDGVVLNRYWDDRQSPRTESWLNDLHTALEVPERDKQQLWRELRASAASGWDFSSRWLADPYDLTSIRTTSLLPVDLNALIYHLEVTLAHASELNNDMAASMRYQKLSRSRRRVINRLFWNARAGWYGDYDWQRKRLSPHLTAATLFPLWLHIASNKQAKRTAQAVKTGLLKAGGLVTTTVNSGQQWDSPNGWPPLQWVAVEGLNYYGKRALARDIGIRFLT